jgi:transposase-like protein
VRLVTQQGRKHAEVAKSLGISEWSVSRWVRAASSEGRKPFAGKDNAPHLNKRSSSYDAESKNSKRSADSKGCRVLCETSGKVRFYAEHVAEFRVRAMCRALVSKHRAMLARSSAV